MGGVRRALAFSFVVLGITSLVAQVLSIRELLFVFTGNEFFIGWTLFAWLFWVAGGALVAGRVPERSGGGLGPLAACHGLAALALPVGVALVRSCRAALGTVPGAVPDLLPAMGFSFAVLAPLCGVLGAQFVLGARAWRGAMGGAEAGGVQSRAYAWETAGFVAGGLWFSLFGVAMDEFQVAGWLGCLNGLAGLALRAGFRARAWRPRLALLALVAAMAAVAASGGRLGRATAAWRFPGQVVVESRNSIHGHLAVTAIGRQLNFHENGLLLGAEDERMALEPLAHYPMLAHPAPKRVLLLGTGFTGMLAEILRHGPERVDHVELDPLWIELARRHLSPAGRAALDDPRVNTVFADGRIFLRQPAAGGPEAAYDVILVNLPDPVTALINRYYSREFCRDAKRRLAPDGVLALRLSFSADHVGRELADLGASILRTLRAEFATVTLLPGDEMIFLASPGVAPPPSADEWIARHAARGLETDFVTPPAIRERLTTDRIGQAREAFARSGARINRDGRPIACHYQFVRWLRSFHPRAAELAGGMGGLDWLWGAGLVAGGAWGMALACRKRRPGRIGAWAMGMGGFTLMACEMTLLLSFQSLCGHLYRQIAMLLAALMLGMAAGTVAGTRRIGRARPRTLAAVHAWIAAAAAGVGLALRALEGGALAGMGGREGVFYLMAALIGGLVGFEFPAASRVHASGTEGGGEDGVVYGADLAGSCLAALLIGLWALPVLGSGATLALLAALNAAVAGIAFRGDPAWDIRSGGR